MELTLVTLPLAKKIIGVLYERFTCLSSNSYTINLPLNQININVGNFYILRLLIRGINTSIGKEISFGIWRKMEMNLKLRILSKKDRQFIETDRVLYNSKKVRLEESSSNPSPYDKIDVGALYIESIDGDGVFKDINMSFQYGIESLPDPINGYHAANKRYADEKFNSITNKLSDHPDVMRKKLEHTFSSLYVFDNFYQLGHNIPPVEGGINVSSFTSSENSFLGVPVRDILL